jgi:hypothetical protein
MFRVFRGLKSKRRRPMDDLTLAQRVMPYLIPYLPQLIEAGKFVGGKALEKIVEGTTDAAWKFVKPWLGKLINRIEESPAALPVAEKVAFTPGNAKYQTALEVQLEDILAADPALAEEIARLLDQAEAGGKQVKADRGGVAFGDHAKDNIVITGQIGGDFVGGDKHKP